MLRTGNDLFPHMWCHHESIICVDQEVSHTPHILPGHCHDKANVGFRCCSCVVQVAFVGSVGLGLGKFDSGRHVMTDAGKTHTWPGMDYSNPRVKDFVNVGPQANDLPGHNRYAPTGTGQQ